MSTAADIAMPLTTEQRDQVVSRTRQYIRRASMLFAMKAVAVDINFDLTGRCAGMYRKKMSRTRFRSRQHREIRYNPYIFARYFEDNIRTTVPHEVAHYVSDIIYGLNNIKPHGKEWKMIMQAFGAEASVTGDYDLSGVPVKRQARHAYRCACRDHQLSTTRHNRIQRNNTRYYCKHCKQPLTVATS